MKRITTPLKWHGGKHYLASKIVSLMPDHKHYVEPYADWNLHKFEMPNNASVSKNKRRVTECIWLNF